MKSFKSLVLAGLAASLACHGAEAQPVYRCGNSYSQTPCAGAIAVPTDDARTDEQRAAARQALASDKALAKEMESSRRKDEAAALAREKALASHAPAHQKADAKKAEDAKPGKKAGNTAGKKAGSTRKVKPREPEFFTATDGASPRKKK